ncbi:hypothetical protein M413DRAFT_17859 [Hebeloma cylindrosporum]|uniref:Peptidase M43 pregnancy-associated plasma-A domain-containing protein n=1 Tax=Hebeloma cylindrosporum TaxID=76867 RepID=A0A0C3CIC3_HEBCY|nr:hypothetical protein M413DRAFT_17859 [Hebeloma cylindrosporum h7]
MFFRNTALALLAITSAVLGSTPRGRTCGTTISQEQVDAAEAHFQANRVDNIQEEASRKAPIDLYFHVIQAGKRLVDGTSRSQIQAQTNVLNKDFAPTGRSFSLRGITRTTNADWFNNAGPGNIQQRAMKKHLRQGGKSTLNVYTVGFTSPDTDYLLGFTTFPSNYTASPLEDGIVILYSSLPGGTTTHFNAGRSLTHETGHWVGLYHTFQGGCTGSGDFVSDTPAEATPASGCPVGRDTCRGGGVDPIHNYMDYSDDSCMNQFTPGQISKGAGYTVLQASTDGVPMFK